MSNALVIKPVEFEVNGEPVKLESETVKNYLVQGNGKVTDQEVLMFTNLCKYQKLNPFLNEAYLIKFGQQPAQIIVSKDAFMKRAETSQNFEGLEAGIIVERDDEIIELEGAVKPKSADLIGGWCRVHRSDRERPIVVKVSIDEFGKGQATWKQMPLNMIRKVAIVNALREAFPNALGGMYTEDDSHGSTGINAVQEYKPSERKDITQDVEVVDEPKANDEAAQIKKAKSEIKKKFKQLGIITKEEMAAYTQKNAPNMHGNSLVELDSFIKLLDMNIEMKKSQEADQDELGDLLE